MGAEGVSDIMAAMPIPRALIVFALSAVLLAACATAREDPRLRYQRCGATLASGTLTTDWLIDRAFIDMAEDQRTRGCYPVTLVAVLGPDGMLYRAAFKPQPNNITNWHYEIGIAPGQAREMDNVLGAKGYTIIWSDTSTNSSGAVLMQVVWVKAMVANATN